MATDSSPQLTLPSALIWHGERPLITFARVAVADLDAPFIDAPLASGKICRFEPLDDFLRDDTDLHIAGAVHHMSRCGSTLVRRQFDAVEGVAALSEPFMFQHLLEGPAAAPDITRRRLRQLAAAWRDGMAPVADRLVIKWPGLLGQYAATLSDALPEVPMIFLHRNATEVLASIAAEPLGGLDHVLPRHLFGMSSDVREMPADPLEAWATLLARTCRVAADTPGLRSVDYATLPDASWKHIADYFGLKLSSRDVAAMRVASLVHSKHSRDGRAYRPDSAAKRATGDDRIRRLAATILGPARDTLIACTPPLPSPLASVHQPSRDIRR